jgi:SAM-dependent methyltransferase
MKTLLHFGCGPNCKKTDWKDFDGSWNVRVQRLPSPLGKAVRFLYKCLGHSLHTFPSHVSYLDLNRSLPFADSSIDAIYASHVWEHLYYEDAKALTQECCRILKPGGMLRLVVPNLRTFIENYIRDASPQAAGILNKKLLFREIRRERSLIYRCYTGLTDFHSHKFMYDPPALIQLLRDAGFNDVSEKECFQSRISEISQVESAERCSKIDGFAVEGVRADDLYQAGSINSI